MYLALSMYAWKADDEDNVVCAGLRLYWEEGALNSCLCRILCFSSGKRLLCNVGCYYAASLLQRSKYRVIIVEGSSIAKSVFMITNSFESISSDSI